MPPIASFQWLSKAYERSLRRALAAPLLMRGGRVRSRSRLAFVLFKALPSGILADRGPSARLHPYSPRRKGRACSIWIVTCRQVEEVVLEEVERGTVRRFNPRSTGFGGGSGREHGFRFAEPERMGRAQANRRRRSLLACASGWPIWLACASTSARPAAWAFAAPVFRCRCVLGGSDYEELAKWRDIILAKAAENPGLANLDSDFYARKPQIRVMVDRNRAGDLGVSLTAVGRTLETMMGSRIVTTYLDRGEQYNVVLQAKDTDRATTNDLTNIYVRSSTTRQLVPLSSLVTIEETAGPTELKALRSTALDHHFRQPHPGLFAGRGARLHART